MDKEQCYVLAWEQFGYCHDIVTQGVGSIDALVATLRKIMVLLVGLAFNACFAIRRLSELSRLDLQSRHRIPVIGTLPKGQKVIRPQRALLAAKKMTARVLNTMVRSL